MKITTVSGKRKKAIARAALRPGSGVVRINRILLDAIEPKTWRLRMREPLILAGDVAQSVDIDIKVAGGGIAGQTEAVRLAIARGLAKIDKKLEKTFLEYDRHLLVADVRQRETRKPNSHGNARGKTQKSYR